MVSDRYPHGRLSQSVPSDGAALQARAGTLEHAFPSLRFPAIRPSVFLPSVALAAGLQMRENANSEFVDSGGA